MDPEFIARLERRALAKHGLPPPSWTDDDNISMHPAALSPEYSSDHSPSHPPDDNDSQSEDDDDEALRVIGEAPPEADNQPPPDFLVHTHRRSASLKELDPHPPANEEVEEDEDEGTTDSEEDTRPKKPVAIPTIRLTLALPTQLPLTTVEQSVSLLAKQAGYHLPADTAITFGASSVPEPEPSLDMPPPPKRRRRRRIQERDEGYDKDDPFVDDSEAFIMEPKYYYPPARDGFFAATGRLELKSDLKKSKPRKTTLKNLPIAPPKPKKRVQLTTLPEPSTALKKLPPPSTLRSKSVIQPTQLEGNSINHHASSRNTIQQTQSTSSFSDSQVTFQPLNSAKQTQTQGSHSHHQPTDQSTNAVQQAQSRDLHTDPQLTSKPPNPISQIQSQGPNKNPQTTSPLQNSNPVPSTHVIGSAILHASPSESQSPTNQTLVKVPTTTSHSTSQPKNQEKQVQAQDLITNYQASSQLPNSTQFPPGKASDTNQKVVCQSPNPFQQTPSQGSNTEQQRQSSPKSIAHEKPFAKTGPISPPLAVSQAAPSQASPQSMVTPLHGFGTPHNPISLTDDEDPSLPHSNQIVPMTSSPGPLARTSQHPRPPYLKSRSLPERKSAGPLPQTLEQALAQLKAKIEAASPFVPKKFPPELKPFTLEVAEMALDMNEYDECFFIRLAELFPYNTFTIKKFVKREILPRRKLYYEGQINQRIQRLGVMIAEEMSFARSEYEQAMEQYRHAILDYEKRQEARRSLAGSSTALPANASTILSDTVTKSPFTTLAQNSSQVPEKPPKAPTKSFKLTEPIRQIIYELVKLEDEHSETVKDTQKIVDKNVTFKDTSNRRQFYARLAQLWPDDFMSTTRLSHIISSMKRRIEGNPVIEPQNLITLP